MDKYEDSRVCGVVGDVYPLEKKEKKQQQQTNNEKTTVTGNDKVLDVEWKSGNYPKGHITTLDQLLAKAKVDTNIWKVKDFVVNKWDVTSWKNNYPETIENFQVKARLEKDIKAQEVKSIAEVFADMCKNYKPPVVESKNRVNYSAENNLLEINIWDLHLGKLAWAGETGENYDTKIARERFLYSIEMLLNRADNFDYSRILFPVGNDFFNSDTILNTTTHGTPQDEDLRWQKTFSVGVKLIVDGISLLRSRGVPVDVIIIPGNHDFERSYYLGSVLEAWYNEDDMVTINNSASPRKYYNFGNVLLGFTHGNEEKQDSLPLLMATEDASKPFWSNTLYHYWHLGHIHRKRSVKYTILDKNKVLDEDLGVTIQYLSSLTGAEEWHHKKGFVGCTKAANAFLWNDKTGLIAEITSNYVV